MNSIFKRVVKILNSPYPLTYEIHKIIKDAGLIGLLVFFIIFLFEPSDPVVDYVSAKVFFKLLSFGIAAFLISFITNFALTRTIPKKINEESWTTKKEIIAILFLLLLISIGNSFVFYFFDNPRLDIDLFITSAVNTLKVGLFPVIISVFIEQNRRLKQNLKTANEINSRLTDFSEPKEEKTKYILKDENNKNFVELSIHDLYYIKSAGNYVEIFIKKKDQIKSVLMRSSLTKIQDQLLDKNSIIKCHRMFLVNIMKIESVEGNSQGYKLKLKDCNLEIPVSRSYTKEFKDCVYNIQLI